MRRFNPEKELYKIQHGNRNRIILFAISLLVVGVMGYSYALYQVRYSKRIIYTKVAPFNIHDLDLAIYVDGKEDELPEKGKGYYYESITCENDPYATAGWDYTNWKIGTLSVTVPNKCNINFTSHPTTLIEQIKYISGNNPELVVTDETTDHNLRYIGANPDNYIWFNCDSYDGLTSLNAEDGKHNCEKWRIIGLMTNMTIVNENTREETANQSLIKIIKAETIGNIAWDSKGGQNGSNDWTRPADLQTSLTNYYNGITLNTKKGISDKTRNMIEQVTWNLGGMADGPVTTAKASNWYTAERENTTYGGQPSLWNGYIALMYPSDYGYATGGGGLGRTSCLNMSLTNWNKNDCAINDWLKPSSGYLWTLTAYSTRQSDTFNIYSDGYINGSWAETGHGVRPTFYLKFDVKIVDGGDGSEEHPYIIVP